MKFGKQLRHTVESSLPEWRGKWVAYKKLKKSIPDPPAPIQTLPLPTSSPHIPRPPQHPEFLRILDNELAKVNDFYLDKQEDHVIHFHVLATEVARVLAPGTTAPSPSHLLRLKTSLVEFHGELVLLENYSAVNCTGFSKILKKHDKKSGASIRDSYLPVILFTPVNTSSTITELLSATELLLDQLNHPSLHLTHTHHTDLSITPQPHHTVHSQLRLLRVHATILATLVAAPPHPNLQERIIRRLDEITILELGFFSSPSFAKSPACFSLTAGDTQNPLTVACFALPHAATLQMFHLPATTHKRPLYARVLTGTVQFNRYTQTAQLPDAHVQLEVSSTCKVTAPWPAFCFTGQTSPHSWTAITDTLILFCVQDNHFAEKDFPAFHQTPQSDQHWAPTALDQGFERYYTSQRPHTAGGHHPAL